MSTRFAVLGVLATVVTITPAWGITVAAATANQSSYLLSQGSAYDGVARITTNNGTCSGSLISSNMILTAAHCVTDATGRANLDLATSYAMFNVAGLATESFSSVAVNPGWRGINSNSLSNDLAIITLSSAAPAGADIYSIYSGSAGSEIGQTASLVGWGYGGTGSGGYDTSGSSCPNGSALDCERVAQNVFDGPTNLFGISRTVLAYDFDSGLDVNNVFGTDGVGQMEGMISPGDSGGPSFINGQIAGVHSFMTCKIGSDGSCSSGPAQSDALLSVYGDIGADTQVSLFTTWINQTLNTNTAVAPVPEPSSALLLGAGAIVLALLRRRRISSL
jgi:secreted trypsin-like serine protease